MFVVCRHKTLLTFIAIPLYIFIALLGAEGSVLCFGDDGHVAIKFLHLPDGSTPVSSFGCAANDDACGSCVDMTFQGSTVYPKAALNDLAPRSPHFSSHVTTVAPSSNVIHNTQPRRILIQSNLSGFKSVVLLI